MAREHWQIVRSAYLCKPAQTRALTQGSTSWSRFAVCEAELYMLVRWFRAARWSKMSENDKVEQLFKCDPEGECESQVKEMNEEARGED